MSDTQSLIGKLLDEDQPRDAIHIAVASVVADVVLSAGMRIGFVKNGSRVARVAEEIVGIVDPFLTEAIYPGDRFFMFLLPNTITSLRHNWTHPAFEAAGPEPDRKAASEAWLRNFIADADCPDYETVIAAAVNPSGWSPAEYLHFDDLYAHGEIPPEFWDHVEIVTGHKLKMRPAYFSCSC